jgi:hypothetical protein
MFLEVAWNQQVHKVRRNMHGDEDAHGTLLASLIDNAYAVTGATETL